MGAGPPPPCPSLHASAHPARRPPVRQCCGGQRADTERWRLRVVVLPPHTQPVAARGCPAVLGEPGGAATLLRHGLQLRLSSPHIAWPLWRCRCSEVFPLGSSEAAAMGFVAGGQRSLMGRAALHSLQSAPWPLACPAVIIPTIGNILQRVEAFLCQA